MLTERPFDLPSLPLALNLHDAALQFFADTLEDASHDAPIGPQLTLLEFVEQAWMVLFPAEPFVSNWHIDAICGHLQAVTSGHIKKLLINVPPGCMKSLLVSVFWPAWEWTRQPSVKYLCASYDQQLSTRDNLNVRNLIESQWYQTHWPQVQLAHDQNQKTRFNTTAGGWRIGTSVGGRATGEHPTRKIIDDPHHVKNAGSKVDRESVINWFRTTLSTRGHALGAATVVIMQRLHEEDLSGWILSHQADQWVHLMLPMRYEPARHCETTAYVVALPTTTAGEPTIEFSQPMHWSDPRTEKGELLWPEFLDAKKVATTAIDLGAYGDAGQNQQRPSPEGGGMFLREWFTRIVPAIPTDAKIAARCRGWDCAATAGGGDWTVGLLMSITTDGRVYVEHVTRGQWGPAEFEGPFGIFQATTRMDPPWTRVREEEEGGSSGKKVIAAHAQMLNGYDFLGVRSTGDKATRAKPFRTQCAVGNVSLIAGAWNVAYVDELCFAKDTLITTIEGDRPIQDIHIGDLVLTRSGWRPVAQSRCTNTHAQVCEITLDDGRTLTATKNHPILVNGSGFIPAGRLQVGNVLLRCIVASPFTAIPTLESHTSLAASTARRLTSTATSGLARWGRSLMDITSTIRTTILNTTIGAIWNPFPLLSICSVRSLSDSPSAWSATPNISLSRLDDPRRVQKNAGIGSNTCGAINTSITASAPSAATNSHDRPGRQNSAASSALPSWFMSIGSYLRSRVASACSHSSRILASECFVADLAVSAIRTLPDATPVFNLEVDGTPEFVANGILVHNCTFRDDGSDQVDDQVDASSCAYNEIALNVMIQPSVAAISGW